MRTDSEDDQLRVKIYCEPEHSEYRTKNKNFSGNLNRDVDA